MINSEYWVNSLARRTDVRDFQRYRPLPSSPCISRTLPTVSDLEKEAQAAAYVARRAHVVKEAMETPLTLPEEAFSPPPEDKRKSSFFESISLASKRGSGVGLNKNGQYEAFEVLRAIEQKDIMTLADVKSRQFDLLLNGNPLPLVYAMRQGKSHAEVAIILIGAMSRKVNDVSDDELALMQPSTKATLRALRANLKIAITASLSPSSNDTSLLSSFLQVLLMLEGTRFLQNSAQTLSLALRSPPTVGKPVEAAQQMVEKWASRELKERQVASVSEYLANAAGDLVMLGIWGLVLDRLPQVDPIPLYYFARDDRIHKAVEERVAVLKQGTLYGKISAATRRQLETTLDVLGRRTMNGPQRIEVLKKVLDRGEKIEGSKVR
ncbi:hypothetical protein JCM11251_003087 [Rhodosporidiobolus azoricus]